MLIRTCIYVLASACVSEPACVRIQLRAYMHGTHIITHTHTHTHMCILHVRLAHPQIQSALAFQAFRSKPSLADQEPAFSKNCKFTEPYSRGFRVFSNSKNDNDDDNMGDAMKFRCSRCCRTPPKISLWAPPSTANIPKSEHPTAATASARAIATTATALGATTVTTATPTTTALTLFEHHCFRPTCNHATQSTDSFVKQLRSKQSQWTWLNTALQLHGCPHVSNSNSSNNSRSSTGMSLADAFHSMFVVSSCASCESCYE